MIHANKTEILPAFGIPNADLHIHFEGAIPDHAIDFLFKKYGLNRQKKQGNFKNFDHFIALWREQAEVMRELVDFEYMAKELTFSLEQQGIVYAEIHFSPISFNRRYNLNMAHIALAIKKGIEKANRPTIKINLIADLIWHYGAKNALFTAQTLAEVAQETGIVGVGLGGYEGEYKAKEFVPAIEFARKNGMKVTVHSGETGTVENLKDVIEILHPDRIGHGFVGAQSPQIMQQLVERNIPLEICVSSNIATGICQDLKAHPVTTFLQRGVPLVIGTDDPAMFNTDLLLEFKLVQTISQCSNSQMRQLMRNGFEFSFETEAHRKRLLDQFDTI